PETSASRVDEVVPGTPDAIARDDVAGPNGTDPARGDVRDAGVGDNVAADHVAPRRVTAVAGKQHAVAVVVDHVADDPGPDGQRIEVDPAVGVVIDEVAPDEDAGRVLVVDAVLMIGGGKPSAVVNAAGRDHHIHRLAPLQR